MSFQSRQEYLTTMRNRYRKAKTRAEKTRILDEAVHVLGYHRKYVIRALRSAGGAKTPNQKHRARRRQYTEALPAIALAWEALDYCCAERLHPVLPEVTEQLAGHGELQISDLVREQVQSISRATLARRLAEIPSPKARRIHTPIKPGSVLRSQVPIGRYDWDEGRPGALEIDLVEHNGGSSFGQYAYTLSVVDVVSGWSRRRAVMGRGQAGIHQALGFLLDQWPTLTWGLHSDNGAEFLNNIILRFAKGRQLQFTRSRPYKKNDNAHVEQKNRQFVRDTVGYARYETPQAVQWLNEVYACLDPYANLFLPSRKVVAKTRRGAHIQKHYDTAQTPFQRLKALDALILPARHPLEQQYRTGNPLALHRRLEDLMAQQPSHPDSEVMME